MNLSNEFLDAIKCSLKEDYNDYKASLDSEAFRGLRVNLLKASPEKLKSLLVFDLEKTPFCDEGFYISGGIKGLGNHPLHHAGAFYLQEPSAMSAVSALDVKRGDRVLDLCAAPGGKSTQIASRLAGEGLLWSNEIVGSRAKILAQNIERCGVRNVVVSSCSPDKLCEKLSGYFDKVLVDAPCSGEGMIRREPAAISEWSYQNRISCATRQLKILDSADLALKSGGEMVYSTCTLSGEENEMVIDAFLKSHPNYILLDIEKEFGRAGYNHFETENDMSKTRRILPQDSGEGHFVAKLKKTSGNMSVLSNYVYAPVKNPDFDKFISDNFEGVFGIPHQMGDSILLLPKDLPDMRGLHIISAGVLCGQCVKNRFVPSHSLYAASDKSSLKNYIDMSLNDERLAKYLHGEEIPSDASGYTAVLVEGIPLGFGKASNGVLKNHYPKGLRTIG